MGSQKSSDEAGTKEQHSDEETARRRGAALWRALSTPHKRQAEMKLGKPRTKRSDSASPKKHERGANGE